MQTQRYPVGVLVHPDTISAVVDYLFEHDLSNKFEYKPDRDSTRIVVQFDDADQAFDFKMRFG